MRWGRVFAIVASPFLGLGFAGWVALTPTAPRWAVALSGVAGIVGMAGAAASVLLLTYFITDWLRPRAMMRRPNLPTALATFDPAFAGQVAFRRYPLKFWIGVIFRERLFIGIMRLDAVENVRLYKEARS